jgi:hypothetical protein
MVGCSFHFVDEDMVLVEVLYRKQSGEYLPVASIVTDAGGPSDVFERVWEIMNWQPLTEGECLDCYYNPKTLRSMMIGDRIVATKSEIFEVASSGFEKVALPDWEN